MDKIYKITDILHKHTTEVDNFNNAVFTDDFEKVADDIVKLFAIPDVSGLLPSQGDADMNKDYYVDAGYSEEYKHAQRVGFQRGFEFVINWIKSRQ